VIVEPDDDPAFLRWLRQMCDKFGIVLIFDEVITGFRYSLGGAQRYWNVTPDLATFGKAMANGMPLAALSGRKHIMSTLSPPDNIFYSGTMFGETLSIAASLATIKKLDREKVPIHLRRIGAEIYVEADRLIGKYDLDRAISLTGQHPRMMINFKDTDGATSNQIKSLFMQQMIQNGVLVINSHNVSFAMGQDEINRVVSAYDATLGELSDALKKGDIASRIGTENLYIWPLRKQ
jgi:glutamate-1-semialdehyde 2,1-aminomutase